MKHRIRKLTSLLLSLSLISALTLPAAASNALGEDLSAKDTLLHQETQLPLLHGADHPVRGFPDLYR